MPATAPVPVPNAAASPNAWAREESLNANSLRALLDNRLACIRVDHFVSPQDARSLIEAANHLGFDQYEQVVPPIDRIGATVFEYNHRDQRAYFERAAEMQRLRDAIFARSFDALDAVMHAVGAAYQRPMHVMSSPTHGSYYACLIRRIEQGTELHIDYAPAEQPSWDVAAIERQLAFNIYLELGPGAGETTIYRRAWQPEDEAHRNPDGYGYLPEVLDGVEESLTFEPRLGELRLFNTRNYHIVAPSTDRRTTAAAAIGETRDGRLVCWS